MAGGLSIASGGSSETGIRRNLELLEDQRILLEYLPWSLKEVYGNGDVGCEGVVGQMHPVRHPVANH